MEAGPYCWLLDPENQLGLQDLRRAVQHVCGVIRKLPAAVLLGHRTTRQHDAWALNPFAYYCMTIGAFSLLALVA